MATSGDIELAVDIARDASAEEVVQLVEARDAVVERLGEERFADVAVQSFLLSPPLRLTGQSGLRPTPEV